MVKQPRVLAICGNAGAGKDTFAALLLEALHEGIFAPYYSAEKYALADALKKEFSQATGFPLSELYTEEGKKSLMPDTEITVRQALCDFSAEKKKYDKNVWLRKTFEALRGGDSGVINIITDVRTLYEYDYLKGTCDLTVIKILRKELPYPPETYLTPMEIEVSSIPAHFTVNNDESLEALKEEAQETARRIFGVRRYPTQLPLIFPE